MPTCAKHVTLHCSGGLNYPVSAFHMAVHASARSSQGSWKRQEKVSHEGWPPYSCRPVSPCPAWTRSRHGAKIGRESHPLVNGSSAQGPFICRLQTGESRSKPKGDFTQSPAGLSPVPGGPRPLIYNPELHSEMSHKVQGTKGQPSLR